ncbi:BMP family lipoprotein [Litorihabitans aurantiacus]|uniref:BMP family ABC transporter substrate-binding protein n=1 Tax=Litorihabitans aurantiacus TaxID=1930061 RepID=A0AA37XFK4_9MICO|nr:BMP family ABC transporter substrate-binding protein [Litorihabitans aurantiacus]GMA32166.1 BMP family ABC transporter substrate-binding protein [Litorihabitans aurantiacus]
MKKSIIAVAGAAAVALTLAACGTPTDEPTSGESGSASEGTSETSEPAENADFKACMVSDQGGYDDQSFNQSGKEGMDMAADELGIETTEIESTSDADYGPNIDSLITDGCSYIIGVGFLLEPAISSAAEANPDIMFGLIDAAPAEEMDNVKPLLFNTAEAAFLAGYVAAGTSESGTVGTFGGLPIPSVQIFMDGFADGVEKYNEDMGASVRLLGWDKEAQTGSFTGDFENQANGTTTAQGFLDQGADVVMPVAGPVGLGAATAVQGGGGTLVWVDSDGFNSTDFGDIIVTSVMKEIGQAVFDSVSEAAAGDFSAEPYVGTLENGGVGIAPYHDFDATVPQELKDMVEDYTAQIVAGDLVIESVNAP